TPLPSRPRSALGRRDHALPAARPEPAILIRTGRGGGAAAATARGSRALALALAGADRRRARLVVRAPAEPPERSAQERAGHELGRPRYLPGALARRTEARV